MEVQGLTETGVTTNEVLVQFRENIGLAMKIFTTLQRRASINFGLSLSTENNKLLILLITVHSRLTQKLMIINFTFLDSLVPQMMMLSAGITTTNFQQEIATMIYIKLLTVLKCSKEHSGIIIVITMGFPQLCISTNLAVLPMIVSHGELVMLYHLLFGRSSKSNILHVLPQILPFTHLKYITNVDKGISRF